MLSKTDEREAVLAEFPTLEKLHRKSVDHDWHKIDYGDHAPSFTQDGRMSVIHWITGPEHDITGQLEPRLLTYALTDHAWAQLGRRLGRTLYGKGSNRTLPLPWMLASVGHKEAQVVGEFANYMNALLDHHAGKWLLRTYKDTMRAILSDRYAVVDNTELIRTLAAGLHIQRQNGIEDIRFPRQVLSPDRMILDATMITVDPNDTQSDYGLGVRIKNNEIGGGALYVLPLIQRNSCANSIVIGGDQYRQIHLGFRHKLVGDMTAAIGQALQMSFAGLKQLMALRTIEVPNLATALDDLAKEYGWDSPFTTAVTLGMEGRNSLYGIINGITAAAQTIPDDDDRSNMEQLAGAMLVKPSRYFRTAWAREADMVIAE